MNYCPQCAGPVTLRIPEGDNRTRFFCPSCGLIHYQNPKMVVGCIPIWGDAILLCKRNIEPRKGYWTLPAGYLECNETSQEGAIRETLEETGALVEKLLPYRLFDLPHIAQVYVMFLAKLKAPDFHPTEESIEVRLFKEQDIPWGKIAFPVIETTLQHFLRDQEKDDFRFRQGRVTGTI